jgi:glycosyltransferase involved in cell wall biosynthesis
MKIVIIINSLSNGGAERVVATLLNELSTKYECHLILAHNEIFYNLDKKINIIKLNTNIKTNGIVKLLILPVLAYRLSKIIKNNNFDTVISFLSRSNYINILSNIFSKHNIIISERAMPSLQYKNGLSGNINKLLIKLLYKKANICIANSQGNKLDLERNFNLNNVIHIPNLFDLQNIVEKSKNTINIDTNDFLFITVGRLDKGKNHKLIIRVMNDIITNGFKATLWIIGDGELRIELENYIISLNLQNNIFLLGKQINPFAYLSRANCFVFSSNHEGFPNVLIEALACGLPVISTDCKSGPREILSPNTNFNIQLKSNIEIGKYGILVPINDKDNLFEAMSLIIQDKNLGNQYKQKALGRANDFSINKIIKRYESMFKYD